MTPLSVGWLPWLRNTHHVTEHKPTGLYMSVCLYLTLVHEGNAADIRSDDLLRPIMTPELQCWRPVYKLSIIIEVLFWLYAHSSQYLSTVIACRRDSEYFCDNTGNCVPTLILRWKRSSHISELSKNSNESTILIGTYSSVAWTPHRDWGTHPSHVLLP